MPHGIIMFFLCQGTWGAALVVEFEDVELSEPQNWSAPMAGVYHLAGLSGPAKLQHTVQTTHHLQITIMYMGCTRHSRKIDIYL